MPKSGATLARHLISINQAADQLGVVPRTVRRMIARGDLTAYRLGGRLIRIDAAELDGLLHVIPTTGGDAR